MLEYDYTYFRCVVSLIFIVIVYDENYWSSWKNVILKLQSMCFA